MKEKKCLYCGKPILNRARHAKYCCPKCQQSAAYFRYTSAHTVEEKKQRFKEWYLKNKEYFLERKKAIYHANKEAK